MKKVIKLVVVTEQTMLDVCRILEQNGCTVSAAQEITPNWEQVWEGWEQ